MFFIFYNIFVLFLQIAFNGKYGLLDCTASFSLSLFEGNLIFSFDVLIWLASLLEYEISYT